MGRHKRNRQHDLVSGVSPEGKSGKLDHSSRPEGSAVDTSFTRRSLLKIGVPTVAILGAGCVLSKYIGMRNILHLLGIEDEEPQSSSSVVSGDVAPVDKREADILRTDEMIKKIETGFARWKSIVLLGIENQIQDPSMKEQLTNPFLLMEINSGNSQKNYLRGEDGRMTLPNPNYFFFRFRDIDSYEAEFSPVERTISVPPGFDPENILDFLVLYHELSHVAQDNGERKTIQSEAQYSEYLRFYEVKPPDEPNVILNYELSAYGLEIELLNLLLDGELKRKIARDEALDAFDIAQRLKVRKDQEPLLDLILSLAISYYPEGQTKKGYTHRFFKAVFENPAYTGKNLFIRHPDGRKERWTPQR